MVCSANSASAQSLRDVVTFLLTNRTVATDDFVRDQQAAKAASDAVTGFLLIDLNALTISTSAGGFTYRLDPEIGISVRSSDSFDPFFTRRALTARGATVAFGVVSRQVSFRPRRGACVL